MKWTNLDYDCLLKSKKCVQKEDHVEAACGAGSAASSRESSSAAGFSLVDLTFHSVNESHSGEDGDFEKHEPGSSLGTAGSLDQLAAD